MNLAGKVRVLKKHVLQVLSGIPIPFTKLSSISSPLESSVNKSFLISKYVVSLK